MDQGLVVSPRKECADDIRINDIREGVASLREIPDEYPLEVRLVADVVVWKEFKPRRNMFPYANSHHPLLRLDR